MIYVSSFTKEYVEFGSLPSLQLIDINRKGKRPSTRDSEASTICLDSRGRELPAFEIRNIRSKFY